MPPTRTLGLSGFERNLGGPKIATGWCQGVKNIHSLSITKRQNALHGVSYATVQIIEVAKQVRTVPAIKCDAEVTECFDGWCQKVCDEERSE